MRQVRVGVTNLTYVLINYVGLEDRQSDLQAAGESGGYRSNKNYIVIDEIDIGKREVGHPTSLFL